MGVIARLCGLSMLVTSLALAGCGGAQPAESTDSAPAGLTVPGSAVPFQTSAGTYRLGPQKDASGRSFSYQVETSTDRSFVTPYSTGWFLSKASPAVASIPVQYVEAELVGTFVKRAGSVVYDAVSAYDTYRIASTQNGAWLDITVDADSAVYPGVTVDTRYAEGAHDVTLQTFIGPQTLLTDGSVSFAYLVKQSEVR